MVGWINELQSELGRCAQAIARAGGYKVTYTLVTDETADPMTTSDLTIYLGPTPGSVKHDRQGGREREVQEIAETYIVSREDLKVGSTYYEPTLHDTFVRYGTTSPVIFVHAIEAMQNMPGCWKLHCTQVIDSHAEG